MGLTFSKNEEINNLNKNENDNNKYEYEYEKYKSTLENFKDNLNKYGVAIIPSVLDKKECDNMFYGTWNFFEYITSEMDSKILKNDSSTWKNFSNLSPGASMLFQRFNAGQSQHSWDLRQNPKIVDIFAKFWNCDKNDLLVSFDGLSFLPPPEITEYGFASNFWFHMDQRFSKPIFDGIQSWVTALDVNENDATLVFFEKSHLLVEEFVKNNTISEERLHNDWAPIKEDEMEFYKKKCQMKAIKCPAGSLVIWDSRLVHCGIGPKENRKNNNFRCINYLSYSPKEGVSEDILMKRQMGFEKLFTSNHYANRATFFPTNPLLLDYKRIDPPKLTQLGRSLVGYKN